MKTRFRSGAAWPWISANEYSPGPLKFVATGDAVQTMKSFIALFAKRDLSNPPACFFHEETVATILPSTPEELSELTEMLSSSVR